MKSGDNRIAIELPKGLKLVAEQNVNPEYQNEIYVGIETSDGIWHQDLAVIRNAYFIDDNLVVNWNPYKFEILVYANKDGEDFLNQQTDIENKIDIALTTAVHELIEYLRYQDIQALDEEEFLLRVRELIRVEQDERLPF